MNIPLNTDQVLELKLSGKFAHFRKFYTNASSLTYTIPPRTTVCGLLASMLQIPRDNYYDLMSSDKLGIAVSLTNSNNYLKIFQTLNYASDKSKIINDLSEHKQCRLELLKARGDGNLEWFIYLCFNSKSEENSFLILKDKIQKRDFGYGIALGQRQFLANLELINCYEHISLVAESDYLDSAINMEQIRDIDTDKYDLIMERMPLEQRLEKERKKEYRQTIRFGNIVVDINGNRITGKFQNVYELDDEKKRRIAIL